MTVLVTSRLRPWTINLNPCIPRRRAKARKPPSSPVTSVTPSSATRLRFTDVRLSRRTLQNDPADRFVGRSGATGQEVATSLLVTVKSNASDLYQSLENDLQTAVVQSTKAQRTQARADGLQLMERLIAIVKQATGGRTLLSYDDFVG